MPGRGFERTGVVSGGLVAGSTTGVYAPSSCFGESVIGSLSGRDSVLRANLES